MRELNQKKLLIIYYYPKILVYNWFRWCIRGLRRLRIYFSRNLSENLADRAELVFLVKVNIICKDGNIQMLLPSERHRV